MSTRLRERRDRRTLRRIPPAALNIVSLIDVFAILVFYLLFNALSPEVIPTPHSIKLPPSAVQMQPHATVVVLVASEQIFVDNHAVMNTADAMLGGSKKLAALTAALQQFTSSKNASGEVNILADKRIPYRVLKKILTACADAQYTHISLAVVEKEPA